MELTQEAVESLKGIALDLDMNFRTDYSGHGMYYKTCDLLRSASPGVWQRFPVQQEARS
jgi:hypothetical protein